MEFNLNIGGIGQEKGEAKVITPVSVDSNTTYDVLILGGGPAGMNAAIYAARKGLKPAILAERLGGQLLDTSEVDNYLGVQGLSGFELANRFVDHARSLEVAMLEGVRITQYRGVDEEPKELHTLVSSTGQEFHGRTVLIATGSKPRKLEIPGEDKLMGSGVSYCAICDGFFFRNKRVVIAGGGNAALEAAIDMAKIASEVIIIQRSHYRADKVLLDQADRLDNVKRIDRTQIVEILGTLQVEAVRVFDKRTKETYDLDTAAVFVEIGHVPNAAAFTGIVEQTAAGEIVIDPELRTSVEGVYAAGDITTEPFKQIIVAASAGAKAALVINQDLNRLSAATADHMMSRVEMTERN